MANGVDDQHRLRVVAKDVPRVHEDVERVNWEQTGPNFHSKISNQISQKPEKGGFFYYIP